MRDHCVYLMSFLWFYWNDGRRELDVIHDEDDFNEDDADLTFIRAVIHLKP